LEIEKAGKIMELRHQVGNGFAAQIKIVPAWAWVLAAVAFGSAQWFFDFGIASHPGAPPVWARPLLGALAGLAAGCYLLFVGYINRDAKRRGMSAALWTLVAVFVSNGLGILLYFILRQPVRSACPECGRAIQAGFNFCPGCNFKLSPNCGQCQRVVGAQDVYCPYCGATLRDPVAEPAK
jgi:RNA polymerase subunit RPABC4/transcription elongation factor Spt4